MRTKLKTGTTAENNSWTLPDGVLSQDIEKHAIRLHDGVTPGGYEVVGTQAYTPPVGPGPTTLLAGDTNAGYYGFIPATELITEATLTNTVGYVQGTSTGHFTGWLKFAHQGRTLYIAKEQMRYNATWESLYQNGLVYGSDTNGPHPVGTATLQNAQVTVESATFRVRLMRGADTDPTDVALNTTHPVGTLNSEWGQLLVNVSDDSRSLGWASFPLAELIPSTFGQYTLCQEWPTERLQSQSRLLRGDTADIASLRGTSSLQQGYGTFGWRPVLELI